MQPLDLHLKPSSYMAWAGVSVWAVLLLLFFSLQPPWWQSLGLFLSAVWYLHRWLRKYAWLQAPDSLQSVRVSVHGWCVMLLDGQTYDAQLASNSRFLPGLIVLRLHAPNRPMLWWLILADSCDEQAQRRMRVWGRWGSYITDTGHS